MADEQQRAELHKTIWGIADELRGAIGGWEFKAYVLGTLFYRFISENLADYINRLQEEAGVDDFDYARMSDEEAASAKEQMVQEKGFLGEEDIAVSNHALIIKHEQNPKFLSYSTQTNSFFKQKQKCAYGVKVTGIKPEHLAKFKMYLPPLSEQSRIVSFLDTFEASISNLESQQSPAP